MTDIEKVKHGLTHCTGMNGCCDCPYSVFDKPTVNCKLQVDKDALSVIEQMEQTIKAQQEEIDRLGAELWCKN